MKVVVVQIAPHPLGMTLGLRIENESRGWIRFSTTVLVCTELSLHERQWLLEALERSRDDALDYVDEPLPFDQY